MDKKIQKALKELNLYSGPIDGLDGPKTQFAIKAFQRLNPPLAIDGNAGPKTLALLFPPVIEERCACTIDDIEDTYGPQGSSLVFATLPYTMKLAWQPDIAVTRFQCHSKVKEFVEAIFEETGKVYDKEQRKLIGLDMFGGCFNIRPMRGGTKPSLHSWGIAIDIDPARNQLRMGRNQARLAKPDALKFWDIVGKHCGVSLGMVKNYDWMHFQFAKVGY